MYKSAAQLLYGSVLVAFMTVHPTEVGGYEYLAGRAPALRSADRQRERESVCCQKQMRSPRTSPPDRLIRIHNVPPTCSKHAYVHFKRNSLFLLIIRKKTNFMITDISIVSFRFAQLSEWNVRRHKAVKPRQNRLRGLDKVSAATPNLSPPRLDTSSSPTNLIKV